MGSILTKIEDNFEDLQYELGIKIKEAELAGDQATVDSLKKQLAEADPFKSFQRLNNYVSICR